MGDTAIGSNNRKKPLNLSAISILATGSTDFLRIINTWLRGQDLTKTIEQSGTAAYYPPFSWHCILAGYGIFPEPQQLSQIDPQLHRYDLTEIDDFIRRSSLNFVDHQQQLQQLHAAN